jgi:predicted glycosyltransferase
MAGARGGRTNDVAARHDPMTVLIWVQHLLGTGHLKRVLTLGRALASRGLDVTVASGGPPAPWLASEGLELVQLPPVAARDLSFSALVDADGRPIDDALRARRRDLLLDLFERLEPRVLVTEMFPFGRRAFRFELLPLLAAAAEARPRTWRVASVRDILVAKPDADAYLWNRDMARAHFDQVLVHGDPKVIPFDLSFPYARDLGALLRHTGYLIDPPPPLDGDEGTGEVLVSAGGGKVAATLLETAIGARALSSARGVRWRLIAGGHGDPRGFDALHRRLPEGMVLERQRSDFQALLAKSLLSVSQAGYNTVVEVLRLGKPMVLVPFETASETEQRLRAERLASLGLAQIVWESDLTSSSLARAIDAALDQPPAKRHAVALDGADASARLIEELAARSWAPATNAEASPP